MKLASLFAITFLAVLLTASCVKKINNIGAWNDGVYNKWPVATIDVQSYVAPVGVTHDTMFNAQPGDYIDLSVKGTIDFFISSQHHVDTYDTAKYNLTKDTAVFVTNSSHSGGDYISLSNISSNSFTLKETIFGVDAGTITTYKLKK